MTLERGATLLVVIDDEDERRARGRETRAGNCRASITRTTLRTSYPTTQMTPRYCERPSLVGETVGTKRAREGREDVPKRKTAGCVLGSSVE